MDNMIPRPEMADPTANSKLLKSKQIKPCVTDSKLFKRKQIVFCVTATVFLLAAGYGGFSIWKSNESRDSANEDISASSVPTKQVEAGFGGSSAQQSNKLKETIEKQSSNKAFNVNALSTTFLSEILTTESTVTSNIVSRTYDIIKEIEEEAKSTLSPKPQSGKSLAEKFNIVLKGTHISTSTKRLPESKKTIQNNSQNKILDSSRHHQNQRFKINGMG